MRIVIKDIKIVKAKKAEVKLREILWNESEKKRKVKGERKKSFVGETHPLS